ncbi:MAG TPA: BRCT domain-containing protein [Rhizobium sp.]|nr:BRCT domain-containing protein [Rhizobium sp.]
MDDRRRNRLNGDRLESRQIDELIGIARGLVADGHLNQAEVEFLQTWLAANAAISDQPVIGLLYARINEVLRDGIVDAGETSELMDALRGFTGDRFELGETMTASDLPVCRPAPALDFPGRRYCFTGTFKYGQRKHCELAVVERGGEAGGLTQKTNVLVIGAYVTDSWKHSSFGNKILQACEWRDRGLPIHIVTETHWVAHL